MLKIETMQQLEELIRLCQRSGIHTVVCDGITLQMALKEPETRPEPEKDEAEVHIDPATGLPFTEEEWKFFTELQAMQARG